MQPTAEHFFSHHTLLTHELTQPAHDVSWLLNHVLCAGKLGSQLTLPSPQQDFNAFHIKARGVYCKLREQ